MDVRCEQCGTEYEFDDAKVTDAGIAVKCTHCGFLFRVTRHSVTVDERPVIAEARPSRPTTTTEMAQLPRAGAPGRARGWMIRKERSTDVLEFKDLSTLQKWILERKVSRDDEISKTGESWKPLGSIVELSSFFLVVEGEALRNNPPASAPEPPAPPTQTSSQLAPVRPNLAPPAPPAPPRGRDDLLDTGQFRLEGPGEAPTPVSAPVTGTQSMAQLQVAPQVPTPAPMITETAAMRRVQIPVSEPGPQVTVMRTPAPRTPLRQEPSVPGFDLGGGAAPTTRGNTARGFVIGVGVTGALFAVAYGAFEHLNTDKGRSALSRPAPATAGPERPAALATTTALDLPTRLDAADARVRTDADSELDLAIPEYDAILAALGEPPADRVLAARALVGKARVLLARAEHRMLGGDAPGAMLAKVNDLLGTARVHAPDLPDIELAWADSLRLRDERVSVRNFLDAAAPKASSRPEYVFLRAMIEGSDDPGAVSDRLAALPPEARSVPRVLLIRGLALEKSGRRDEALQVVMELLRATPSHVQAIDLKTRLTSGTAPPVAASLAPSAPVTAAPAPVSAAPAPVTAAPAPATSAPAPATAAPAGQPGAVRVAEEPTPIHAGDDFDGLMLRGARNLEAGKPEIAARFFEKASQSKPRSPEPFANLGWCYVDQHRYAEALTQFQQALDRSPRYSDALYGVAEAYEKAGKTSDAVTAYKAFLDAHPKGRRADMARRRLERLQ
jgi:predicted Zn finger-like uncharacterized protein